MTSGRALGLQAVVSILALAGVGWWISRQPVPSLPSGSTALWALLVAVAVYAAATIARGERWHRLLESSGVRSTRLDAYALTTVGYMGNNALPARAGDLLKVVLSANRGETKKRTALGAAVAERLLDVIALAVLFAVLIAVAAGGATLPHWASLPLLGAIAAIVVAVCGAAVWRLRHVERVLSVLTAAAELLRPCRALLSVRGAGLLGLSFGVWALEASVYLAIGRAVGVPLDPVDAMYVMALTNLVALIPAAPGYVGTFDAAVIFALKAVGKGSPLAYVVALRLVLFVPITLVGLAFLLVRYGGLAPLRAMRLQAASTP